MCFIYTKILDTTYIRENTVFVTKSCLVSIDEFNKSFV